MHGVLAQMPELPGEFEHQREFAVAGEKALFLPFFALDPEVGVDGIELGRINRLPSIESWQRFDD